MRRNPHFHFSEPLCLLVGCNYLHALTLIITKCLESWLGGVIACYLHGEFWLLQEALEEKQIWSVWGPAIITNCASCVSGRLFSSVKGWAFPRFRLPAWLTVVLWVILPGRDTVETPADANTLKLDKYLLRSGSSLTSLLPSTLLLAYLTSDLVGALAKRRIFGGRCRRPELRGTLVGACDAGFGKYEVVFPTPSSYFLEP